MDTIGEYHVKLSKLTSERQSLYVFFDRLKIDPTDKHVHKNKHDNMQTHM
jgi:hypothetical protein